MHSGETRHILVVDDNPFNRGGLVAFLENGGFSTCEASNKSEAIAVAAANNPVGAIVDIVIPKDAASLARLDESVGLEVVRWLKEFNPSMGVVVFSAYDDRGREMMAMVRDGTFGLAYMLKGSRPERVLGALEQALAGNVLMDPEALANVRGLHDDILNSLSPEERPWVLRAVELMPTLSDREREVAVRLANSQNVTGIAKSMGLKQSTVENHITSLYKSLELSAVDRLAPTLRKSTLLAKACILYALGVQGLGRP